ncbi:phosphoesterase [Halosimplex halophilum]|uniref:phosphoesterase n=1 Tax=Halosimplex halophilum TaxID=2559572 RepID=UPI00107F90EC|nr:phosphoesterase [Halosimplex halophilum]
MSLLGRAVDLYGYVFHPSTVIGLGVLLLIHYEWAGQSADRSLLWKRWGAFVGAGVLGFVPTLAFFALQRGTLSKAFSGSSWQLDMMVASGVVLGAAITWGVWRRYDWGRLVPGGMAALIAVVPPYAALSPFWDISGHVIFALAPTLYLALLDRKFLPLLAIPVVMVPTRVLVNAHSALESVAGFVVAAAIVVAVYLWRSPGSEREATAATAP